MTKSRASGSIAFSCSIRRLTSLHEFDTERSGKAVGDFVLRYREVGSIGIKPLGPKVRAVFGVDELRVYPNLIAGAPHAPFEHITDAELTADLLRVERFAFIGKSGIAGDHKAAGNTREIGGQIVGNAVGKIFLLRDRSTDWQRAGRRSTGAAPVLPRGRTGLARSRLRVLGPVQPSGFPLGHAHQTAIPMPIAATKLAATTVRRGPLRRRPDRIAVAIVTSGSDATAAALIA